MYTYILIRGECRLEPGGMKRPVADLAVGRRLVAPEGPGDGLRDEAGLSEGRRVYDLVDAPGPRLREAALDDTRTRPEARGDARREETVVRLTRRPRPRRGPVTSVL